jgi:hypothetical protein
MRLPWGRLEAQLICLLRFDNKYKLLGMAHSRYRRQQFHPRLERPFVAIKCLSILDKLAISGWA